MKKKIAGYFCMMLAALGLVVSVASCSDNIDPNLSPTEVERTLMVNGHSGGFTIDLKASPDSVEMNVESNTLWKVVVSCEGGWCSVDKLSGRGSEKFHISVLENMNEPRQATVTVYMTDADGEMQSDKSIEIMLKQEVSNVRLSPSSVPQFAPQGNDRRKFEIISNVPWKLDVSYEGDDLEKFVGIHPDGGTMTEQPDGSYRGDGEASFYISVADNRTSADRKAFLNLSSDVGTYQVEIVQIKPTYDFVVSPAEELVVDAAGATKEFSVLSLSDDGWEVKSDATWITFSVNSVAAGSFDQVTTVATIAPNSSGRERGAEIVFRPKDTHYQPVIVRLIQQGFDARFSVAPLSTSGDVAAGGGTLRYEIDSRFDWKISAPTWMTVSPASGTRSDSPVIISVDVAPNLTSAERTGILSVTPLATIFPGGVNISPTVFDLKNSDCEIRQSAFAAVFDVSRSDSEGVVMEEGGVMEFDILSSFDWQVALPTWMSVDAETGTASSSVRKIRVTVAPNRTNDTRTGLVSITPLPTSNNVGTLDPGVFGYGKLSWPVTQFGGREPAISVPWLVDEYDMTKATVEFNFYSPFRPIVTAGLEWRREADAEWSVLTVTPGDATDATVTFHLTGLDPATKYVARGYVVDSDGNVKRGATTYPFTTAGRYPESGDNPVP